MNEKEKQHVFPMPVGQFSWPYLAEPNNDKELGDGKYGVHLLIDKDDWKNNPRCKEYKAAIAHLFTTKEFTQGTGKNKKEFVPKKIADLPNDKICIQDGDEIADAKGWENYRGKMVIKAKTKRLPVVVDAAKQKMDSSKVAAIKGGDFGLIVVTPFYYPQGGGGVSNELQVVQFWKEGEGFAGANTAEIIDGLEELEVDLEPVETGEVDLDNEEDTKEEPKKGRGRPAGAKGKKQAAPKAEEDDEEGIDLDDF